ncbi:MAG: hypothetical protein P4L56_03550 [Candidatus Sulfopaludibacter sp.]|nr:hypothetical protein [Candidatus Sulfopaludibacter sp.]
MKPRPSRRSVPPPATAIPVAPHTVPWPILLAAALLLLACFSPAFQDHDAWWQLKTGQYIVQNHKLPVPDPFAFTTYLGQSAYPGEDATRYFNLTHEWLAQAFMYAAYAAGGFPLVVLLRALLLAAAAGVTGLIAFRRTGSFYSAIGAALLSATISYRFAYDRPLLVTFLFVALVMAMLEYRRWLWALPVLFVIWANCHGGFFMGWAVLAAYCAEGLVRRRPDRLLYGVTATSVLASGLNPNGFRVFATLLYYRQSYMQSLLAEWRPTPLWPLSPFVAIAAAAGVLLVLARGKARVADWLLFGAFAVAGLYAFRNVVYMSIAGPVMIASYLPWKLKPLAAKWELAIAVILLAAIALPASQKRTFQFSAWEATRPAGAVRFLLAHHVTGPLFNTYEQGGYLMWSLWPQLKVFVDGRALNETAFRDYRRIAYSIAAPGEKNAFQLLDQYGVQTIVMTGYEYFTGSPHFLIAVMADPKQAEWKLVYQDAQAMIFMRRPPAGVQPLPNIAALASMQAQCAAHITLVPGEPLCARETCKLYEHLGNLEQARAWMAYYLEHKKQPDPEAEAEYQRLSRR